MAFSTNLCDLPPELFKSIAEITDTRARCVLRKCGKDYRQLVDESHSVCKVIRVQLRTLKKIVIEIEDEYVITYTQKDGGTEISRKPKISWRTPDYDCFLSGEDHLETAINDIMSILKNRRTIVKNLSIRSFLGFNSQHTAPFIDTLQQNLSTLNHQLHVEKFKLWRFSEDEMMKIFPFVQPETLKILKISLKSEDRDVLRQIIHTDQWKQAEELVSTTIEPLDEILHFKKVRVHRQFQLREFYPISMEALTNFFQKVIAQSDRSPLEFHAELVQLDRLAIHRWLQNYESTDAYRNGESRHVLRTFEDGSKLIFVIRFGYLAIVKYPFGRDTSY